MVATTRRSITAMAVALMLLFSGFAGIAAAEHDPKDPDHDDTVPDTVFGENTHFEQADEVTDGAAANRVRKAFLQAKKAFHEARQEIQAIKKGDESAVEDVPTFFDSEDGGDEDSADDEEYKDGSDPEVTT